MRYFIFIAALCCVQIGLNNLQTPLQSLKSKVETTRKSYLKAITDTQTELTRAANEIAKDQTLNKNLNSKLDHSVKSHLRGLINYGQVDGIRIFDVNCQRVLDAGAPLPGCKHLKSALLLGGFFWTEKGDTPRLNFATTLQAGKTTWFLTLFVSLNKNWLNQHPRFASQSASIQGIIGGKGTDNWIRLAEIGHSQGGKEIASFYTAHPLLNIWPGLIYAKSPPLSDFIVAMNYFILGTIIALGIWYYRESRIQLKSRISFIDWCAGLCPEKLRNAQGSMTELHSLQELLGKSFDDHFRKTNDLKNEVEELQIALTNQNIEKNKVMDRLHEFHLYESLSLQCQQTARGFVDYIKQLTCQSEDLSDGIRLGILKNAKKVEGVISDWEDGLGENSARKFFRSLSERPSDRAENMLSENISDIVDTARDLNTQSISLAIQTQKLLQGLKHSGQIANHWQNLVTPVDNATSYSGKAISLILESQNLLPFLNETLDMRFTNLIDEEATISERQTLPKATWVSIFYHLHMALIVSSQELGMSSIEIQNRYRARNNQKIIILTLANQKDMSNFSFSAEGQKHLEFTNRLLQPYGVKSTVLPSISGVPSLTLSWEEETISQTAYLPEDRPRLLQDPNYS